MRLGTRKGAARCGLASCRVLYPILGVRPSSCHEVAVAGAAEDGTMVALQHAAAESLLSATSGSARGVAE
jgi:hypothetical protein